MIDLVHSKDQARLQALLARIGARGLDLDEELRRTVDAIIGDVRRRGDGALIEYSARFDNVQMHPSELRVQEANLLKWASRVEARVVVALREAIRNVRAFHEREREKSWEFQPAEGVRLGQRLTPVERAGLYVPGGNAAYPSSVVMNVVPAQVAGVERIVVTTPPRTLAQNPAVAAALLELNVTEIYSIGGAQAIAALAYGTETLPRVDKITGPGNKYVAMAKKLVFGVVGIDTIAGPSEVVIIADETARPDFLAADLLAQAEHSEDASAVLLTTSEKTAKQVVTEITKQTASLPRGPIVEKSLADYGGILIVRDMAEACTIVNELAPEHLEIVTQDDEAVAQCIRHAGAIFLGAYTPEAVGDYFAGPNHILPTGRAARFSSALGVYDFVKRTSILSYSREELNRAAPSIIALAEAEGFVAHARSVLIRSRNP
ncbi:MAG: histidinol dehydrogenase [bacterium]